MKPICPFLRKIKMSGFDCQNFCILRSCTCSYFTDLFTVICVGHHNCRCHRIPFTFDKIHYSMPRKYLRQELEIRAGEKEIYVYNKQGDHIRTHKRSYTPKDWGVIPSDKPAEYKDYGYWNVPFFQHKVSMIGPNTRALIDAVIQKSWYPVQPFRSCFGILRCAEKYSPEALERCCKDAVLAGKCNYSYGRYFVGE